MRFRIGIIGCGRIVEEAHVPALVGLGEVATVVALADPSAARRQIVAEALSTAPHEYDDWRAMLRSEELDVAVIATPHHLHTAAIVDSAAAGLDIISEKPLATTAEEIEAIADAVAAAGVRLSVMHNWMWNADARTAIELIADGVIGDPFLVRTESIWGVPWASRDPGGNWRLNRAQSGGGIVIDAVYHPIYVSEAEMGQPVVSVFASLADQGSGVEDTAVIVLEHEHGGITSIQRSWAVRGGGIGVHEVHGSRGSIRFHQGDPLVTNRIMAGEPPPAAGRAAPALELFSTERGVWEPVAVETGPWWAGIRSAFAETFAAWSASRGAPAGIVEASHVLDVVTAIYSSAERRQAVTVPRRHLPAVAAG